MNVSREDFLKAFIVSYFDSTWSDDLLGTAKSFIDEFPAPEMREVDRNFIAFVNSLGVKNLMPISPDEDLRSIKAQFHYVVDRQKSIVELGTAPFLKNGTNVYGTNLFIKGDLSPPFFMKKIMEELFGKRSTMRMEYDVIGGADGYIFTSPNTDWSAVDFCDGRPGNLDHETSLRLFLVGDIVYKAFREKDYKAPMPWMVKNFHSGRLLINTKTSSSLVSDKIIEMETPEEVSDTLSTLVSKYAFLQLIQRDYIWDFSINSSVISLLFNYYSPTSIIKNIIPHNRVDLETSIGIEAERMSPTHYRIRKVPPSIMKEGRLNNIIIDARQGIPITGVPNAYLSKDFGVCIYPDTTIFVAPITQTFDPRYDIKEYSFAPPNKLFHAYEKYHLMLLESTGPEIYSLIKLNADLSPIKVDNLNLWNTVITLLTYNV